MPWGNFQFAGQRRAEGGLGGDVIEGRARALFGGMNNRTAESGGFAQSSAGFGNFGGGGNPFQAPGSQDVKEIPAAAGLAQSNVLRNTSAQEAPVAMPQGGEGAPTYTPSQAPTDVTANMNSRGGPAGLDLEELLAVLRGRAPGQWDPERRSVVQTKPSVEEQAAFSKGPDVPMLNSLANIWKSKLSQ